MPIKVIQGIPFVVENKKIYAYEKPSLCLGTYDAEKETFTLVEGWQELYAPLVEAHRQTVKARSRLPATTQTR